MSLNAIKARLLSLLLMNHPHLSFNQMLQFMPSRSTEKVGKGKDYTFRNSKHYKSLKRRSNNRKATRKHKNAR